MTITWMYVTFHIYVTRQGTMQLAWWSTTATALTALESDITSVNITSNVWLTLLLCYTTVHQVKPFFFEESKSTGPGGQVWRALSCEKESAERDSL
jgi:hypothetical protein